MLNVKLLVHHVTSRLKSLIHSLRKNDIHVKYHLPFVIEKQCFGYTDDLQLRGAMDYNSNIAW